MTTWTPEFKHPIDYLALESSINDLLLLEDGSQIILEQTGMATSLWSNQNKS